MDKTYIDLLIQGGALVLLALVLYRIDQRLSAFLVSMESIQAKQAETLAGMRQDNELHYRSDSYEQKAIADRLVELKQHVTAEHVETRKMMVTK